jgi:hypothetical protein
MTSTFKKASLSALAAATLMGTLAISTTDASAQWRRHHYRGGGWGPGIAAGVVGGLALGALATRPYYYDPYYAPAPVYYPDDPYYAPPPRRCWIERREIVDPVSGYVRIRGVRVCR